MFFCLAGKISDCGSEGSEVHVGLGQFEGQIGLGNGVDWGEIAHHAVFYHPTDFFSPLYGPIALTVLPWTSM